MPHSTLSFWFIIFIGYYNYLFALSLRIQGECSLSILLIFLYLSGTVAGNSNHAASALEWIEI